MSASRLYALLCVLPLIAGADASLTGLDGFEYPAEEGVYQCVSVAQYPIKKGAAVVQGLPTWVRDDTRSSLVISCDQRSVQLSPAKRFMPVRLDPGYSAVVTVVRLDDDNAAHPVAPYFLWKPPGDPPTAPSVVVTIRQ